MPVKTADELRRERMEENLLRDDMDMFIPYLEDETVTDIAVPDSGELVVTRFGRGREFTGITVPEFVVERVIKATAAINGRPLESYTGFPVLEGVIPKYNARITALMKPICVRPELQMRMPPRVIYTLEDYVKHGQMTDGQLDAVVRSIRGRDNIIVSGATGSGKTTFVNAVIQKMVELTPNDNFYIVEDNPELQCRARMKTMLWIPKEFAHKAVEEALRFSPDRIIFGEVRSGRVMRALLEAWETGHSGNVTTLHANGGRGTLLRIKAMLGSEDAYMADALGEVVQLVVHLKKTGGGIRVNEIYPLSEMTDGFPAGMVQQNLAQAKEVWL